MVREDTFRVCLRDAPIIRNHVSSFSRRRNKVDVNRMESRDSPEGVNDIPFQRGMTSFHSPLVRPSNGRERRKKRRLTRLSGRRPCSSALIPHCWPLATRVRCSMQKPPIPLFRGRSLKDGARSPLAPRGRCCRASSRPGNTDPSPTAQTGCRRTGSPDCRTAPAHSSRRTDPSRPCWQ